MQVLQDAHHGAVLTDGVQQRDQRVEQLPPVVAVVTRRGLQIRPVPPYQWRQPQQFSSRIRQAGGQRALGRSAEQMFDALDEGLVGKAGLGRTGP